jgi:hypothetical protein
VLFEDRSARGSVREERGHLRVRRAMA